MKNIYSLLLASFLFLNLANAQSAFDGPITDSERSVATSELIALINDTHYFDFVESRIHGVPESSEHAPFWWAHFWQGVNAVKSNGLVTYIHGSDGSDNVGIQSSFYLENACFMYKLTGNPKYSHMARALMRGFSSWILSSVKSPQDQSKVLLRAFYPNSILSSDHNRNIYFNYDASRPGVDGVPSFYVHNEKNPYFGDIWLKSNRSIDDLGHMIRAIAHLQSCREVFDDEANADLDLMNSLYTTWATDVDHNGFIIPTLNKNMEIYVPKGGLGDYNNAKFLGIDPFCVGRLAVRLLHSDNAGDLNCGEAYSSLERIFGKFLNNDPVEIIRSHHVAAVALSEQKHQSTLASDLRNGLKKRMDFDFSVALDPKIAPKYDIQDIYTFLIQANNIGMELTPAEIRSLYQRLHIAFTEDRSKDYYSIFNLFSSTVPDGQYSYNPPHRGLYFYAIGSMLGSCTSEYNKNNKSPYLDCRRLKEELF